MVDAEFDLFVIGGGSGGVRASRLAANLGLKVGIAEEYRLGGTCVIRGCIPKKLMVFASDYANKFKESEGFGWQLTSPSFSWVRFSNSMRSEIDRLEEVYENILSSSGVKIFKQKARIHSEYSVILDDGVICKAKYILLAGGGTPSKLQIKGEKLAITSNEIFSLKSLPKTLTIIGGGYIACEFASIFNGLGTKVTLVYRGEMILRGFDNDIRDYVERVMRSNGVVIKNNTEIIGINKSEERLTVELSNGEKHFSDQVLLAVGRQPRTEGLGLDRVNMCLTKSGAIQVDEFQKTSVASIFAVGDITDRFNLTPVAIRDAAAFVKTVFEGEKTPSDHQLIPTAVFTRPEVGTVGLTEEEAKASYSIKTYKTLFSPMGNRLSKKAEKVFMKLLVCSESDKVLGCHMVGEGASEIIQIFGIAIKMGARKSDLDATCAVHPTLAEELVTLR